LQSKEVFYPVQLLPSQYLALCAFALATSVSKIEPVLPVAVILSNIMVSVALVVLKVVVVLFEVEAVVLYVVVVLNVVVVLCDVPNEVVVLCDVLKLVL